MSLHQQYSLLYALRVLRAHGLSGPNLWDITRATAVVKLTYACSAWWGYVDSGGKARIQSVLNKLRRLGFLAEHISLDRICLERDTIFFSQILINPQHVLHQLLPLLGRSHIRSVLGFTTANCLLPVLL